MCDRSEDLVQHLVGDAAETAQSTWRGDRDQPREKPGECAHRRVVAERGQSAGAVQALQEHGAAHGVVIEQSYHSLAVPGTEPDQGSGGFLPGHLEPEDRRRAVVAQHRQNERGFSSPDGSIPCQLPAFQHCCRESR
ncbi:hypothetical protein GCM10018773_34840 [Streptomyces candidus]|nr:hypothetical protein GCM10018773_34840 [Streptomyces candidus]